MNMSIRFPHLGIDLGYVGKTVSVFGFELTIYGILVMAGMLLGLTVVVLQAKRQNQDQNLYLEALIPGVVFGVICARACYIALNWKLFADEPTRALWDLRTGGLSFYGGFAGGVIALAVFCKIRKLSFGRMADTLSIGLVSSQMIGTWGNFFSREFIGTSTDSIFAMQIPVETVGSMELTSEMQKHLVKAGDVSWVQVHPLWFYESLWCLLLLVILLAYTKRKKFQGEIFMRYLAGYALGNAGIEWLRSGRPYIPGTHLPVLIPILLGIFVFSVLLQQFAVFFQRNVRSFRNAGWRNGMHPKKSRHTVIRICRVLRMSVMNFGGFFQKQESQRLKQSQILQKNQTNYRKRFQIPDKQKTR